MAKLSQEEINKELLKLGYVFLEGEYKNLKSVIIVACKEGHEVATTLHDLRKGRPCPSCRQFEKTTEEEKMLALLPKKTGSRVLALDNATYTTGYSIFEDGKLIKYGIKTLDKSTSQKLRIVYMKEWFISMLQVWEIDAVGMENVQYQGNPQVLITLSKLLGTLETASLEFGIEPYVVSSQTWKSFCKIKGKTRHTQKENAIKHVKSKFDLSSVSSDAADAICLGEYVAAQERFSNEKAW